MRSTVFRFLIAALCLGVLAVAVVACGTSNATTTTAAPAAAVTTTAAQASTGTTAASATNTTTAASATTTAAASGPAKPIKIAFFSYNPSPLPAVVFAAMQEKAKELGNITCVLFQGTGDGKAQEIQVQDAIQTGEYAGFVLEANDGQRLQPDILQAQKKGIVTVELDATLADPRQSIDLINEPGVAQTIGYPFKEGAQLFFDAAMSALDAKNGAGKGGTIAIMPGMTNFPADAIRIDLIKQLAAAKGNVKVVIMPDGDYNTSSAQRAALDFFQSQQKVDVIVTFADQMAQGIQVALQQQGLTPGKDVYIVAQGGTVEAVQAIKSGQWWASERNYPKTEGTMAVQTIVDVLAGKTVQPVISNFDTPPAMITKQTLEQYPNFVPEWSTAAS